ncbi:glycosyltransferase [Xanthomonas nasturtii]|uniref:Glycosyltransferase n=1 Tax=Xanthomonas nasturtii TaxID=1843581 RepID=A0ABT0LP29_9XANT|nr:glycosyltransferase [Xanthomonas nasturtii]MCL1526879.1 glycosyltransferase [Xanthomonas nasturtii]MCL1534964.1 glycosyltransferase [Xanthomonas nasturtii]MCL1544019.1 glycosyltransferase [Xanthomonas nasturtii]MCL1551036.1 glycosyltransferase [Xanthomonas nasturtii]MCL1555226.1 glycosyltransferase [Xanthomonas nasturtii]
MHRLTVVQLLPALQSGGVERSTLEIAAALVRAGHRAVVVSAGGRLVQPLLDAGGEHLTLDIGRKSLLTLRHVVGLRRLFAELGADIVHARSRLPAWLGWYALRGMPAATRPRLVTTVHGLNSPSRYSAVMTYGERVICVSQTVRDYVCTHYPQTDPARLRTIARGVDIAQFPRRLQPDRRARAWAQTLLPGLPADAPLLLLPGRGTRLKGHADGLQLLADVRAAGTPAFLWLPGAREPGREAYVRELEAQAARLGVADAVAFTEPTARIAEAYAASNLVLQLSRKPEAFGRTVVEALSVGRPVLGWAHGGVGELLAELQPSGAVAAFDTQALRTQALQLLQQAPAAPAVLPYTLQAMQTATLKVYDELRH